MRLKKFAEKAFFVLGRSGQGKRQEDEIGIHAVRVGNIVGEHEIIIGTDTQTITLKHEASSRSLFAEGSSRRRGVYDRSRTGYVRYERPYCIECLKQE